MAIKAVVKCCFLKKYHKNNFNKFEAKEQVINPIRVGRTNARTVYFTLLVSFLIVQRVVPQGKCIRVNRITQIAVIGVQL